jgi:hypothetical protein
MDSERVVVRADPTEGSTCFNALDWEQCVRSEQQGHRSLSHDAVLSFALSDIETLEMSHGTSGKAGLGALIGFGVGAAVGVVAVAMDDPPPPCSPVPGCTGGLSCGLCMGDIISIGPVEAGALLGVVGAGIGAALRTEKWEPVELRDAKPLVALHPTGRFRVGFTLPVGR